MLKILMISILIMCILILILLLSNKSKTIEKIIFKIKDLFNTTKYKRKMNTFETKYHSRNDDYINILEDYHIISMENKELVNRIKDLKKENKELKRTIEEDMVPKKKRGK